VLSFISLLIPYQEYSWIPRPHRLMAENLTVARYEQMAVL